MKVICRRTGEGLLPADQFQAELIAGAVKLGELVALDLRQDRNPQFHRKFFAMLKTTFDNQDAYDSFEAWRSVVTVGAGFCTFTRNREGDLIAVPRSIAFEKMDQLEFQQLYQDAINYIDREHVHSRGQLMDLLEFI